MNHTSGRLTAPLCGFAQMRNGARRRKFHIAALILGFFLLQPRPHKTMVAASID